MTHLKRYRWAIYSGVGAVWDLTVGVISGHWYSYALAALMVACAALSIYFTRQRKATPEMATNRFISNETLGGYISNPSATANAPATPKVKEFTGLPFDFTLGEVYGLRMWRMDNYGRLRARNWFGAEPWRPGVNVAKCVPNADNDVYRSYMRTMMQATGTEPPKDPPKPKHDTPSESCTCGFYAYTDPRYADTVSYKNDCAIILGIVKGTGRTLLGTQGFRCEKAEIVAFRDPTRGGTKDDPWRTQQLANLQRIYPDVPILASREALLEFAPLTNTLPDPSTDEFWALP